MLFCWLSLTAENAEFAERLTAERRGLHFQPVFSLRTPQLTKNTCKRLIERPSQGIIAVRWTRAQESTDVTVNMIDNCVHIMNSLCQTRSGNQERRHRAIVGLQNRGCLVPVLCRNGQIMDKVRTTSVAVATQYRPQTSQKPKKSRRKWHDRTH